MAEIRLVFFDATGTLIRIKGSIGKIYAEIAQSYHVTLNSEDLNHSFKNVFRKAPPLCFPGIPKNQIEKAERGWWRNRVCEALDIHDFGSENNFESFFEELYETFATKKSWQVFDDALPILNVLRQENIAMAVISNFDSRLLKILNDLDLESFFDFVTCSTQVGYTKPSAEIFMASIPPSLHPHEVIHVGNSMDLDYLPTRDLGFLALLLKRKNFSWRKSPSFEIHSLSRLLDYL